MGTGSDVRAVLVTGDTSTAILPRDSRLRLASKPLNAEELLSILRELMAVDE
jgi:two-component system, sensor histidine kinase